MAPFVDDIKLEDIDFDKVKGCSDKHVLKRYIKLLEDDNGYFMDLLKACRQRLLEVDPKEYYLMYPLTASEDEVAEALRDVLEWEAVVKETDAALQKSKKDQIWEHGASKVRMAVRGQEATIARPSIASHGDRQSVPNADNVAPRNARDAFARDKTKMKDYYAAWDKVDMDALEQELDQEEQRVEESRRCHFEDLRKKQEEAGRMTAILECELPGDIPEAHRKHMADSEKEKGNEAFYSKDFEEAEAYYTRSIHFRNDDPSTWANRALARLKLGKPEAALEDCERSLALNPRYVKALHRKAKALHELKHFEEAVRCFQVALVESPGNSQINGDLMLSRRHLRNACSEQHSQIAPVVDGPSECRIEELEDDDDDRTAHATVGSPYTRVQIEEESDDDSNGLDGGTSAGHQDRGDAPTSSMSSILRPGAFHKVAIIEDDDTGDGQLARAGLGTAQCDTGDPAMQSAAQAAAVRAERSLEVSCEATGGTFLDGLD